MHKGQFKFHNNFRIFVPSFFLAGDDWATQGSKVALALTWDRTSIPGFTAGPATNGLQQPDYILINNKSSKYGWYTSRVIAYRPINKYCFTNGMVVVQILKSSNFQKYNLKMPYGVRSQIKIEFKGSDLNKFKSNAVVEKSLTAKDCQVN